MAVTEGDTPAKPCVCASMEAAQSCSGGRGVTGSRGQAGRQGHSPALALRMLSIPALPGCPLHLGLDHAHGNARKKDLFPPSFLPYLLIQRVKCSSSTGGIFLPLSSINESQTTDVPGRQQRGCKGHKYTLHGPGKAGKPLLAWGKSSVGAFLRGESHHGPGVPAWVTS